MTTLTVSPASYPMTRRERKYFVFDFTADLDGRTITSAAAYVTIPNVSGINLSSILDGSPVINGATVGQWVHQLPVLGNYRLTIAATYSDGSVSEPEVTIRVGY